MMTVLTVRPRTSTWRSVLPTNASHVDAAPSPIALASAMSKEELQDWMVGFRDASGNVLFADASKKLQYTSVPQIVKATKGPNGAWQDVTMLLFEGDETSSLIFKLKVKDAADQERARNSKQARRTRLPAKAKQRRRSSASMSCAP